MRKLFFAVCWLYVSQLSAQQLIFPDTPGLNNLTEGDEISFAVAATDTIRPRFSLEGVNEYKIQFDSSGHFNWKPPFDMVNRLEPPKEVNLIFQAEWPDGRRVRKQIAFTIQHKNRPPTVEDLPVFYVKQSTSNRYQIPSEYVKDADGDPLVFKVVPSQLPEGATMSSLGLLSWTPSRNQFNNLKKEPVIIEFAVQDQPDKAETTGKIRIAQTQLDLPPEMLMLPSDSSITIKEDQLINFKIYTSDPNGDENI